MVIQYGDSATAIQTSPTSVEVVLCGNKLLRLKFGKCYYQMLGGVYLLWVWFLVMVVVRLKS